MDALACIMSRRSRPRLADPAPDEYEVEQLLAAASAAPDHGELRPWRFVVISGDGRRRLGELFAAAHRDREPDADVGAVEKTAAKPLRAPMLVAVICQPVGAEEAWNGKDIPVWEQEAATAAATQNLLLAAHALGYGAMWRTGWFGDAPRVREAFGLGPQDRLVAWVYLGTAPGDAVLAQRRAMLDDSQVTRWDP